MVRASVRGLMGPVMHGCCLAGVGARFGQTLCIDDVLTWNLRHGGRFRGKLSLRCCCVCMYRKRWFGPRCRGVDMNS